MNDNQNEKYIKPDWQPENAGSEYAVRIVKGSQPANSGNAAQYAGQKKQLSAEDYVKGELAEFPDSLKKFEPQFEELKTLFADAKVELEGEWGFTIDWEACGWMAPEVWGRVKLDAIVHETETSARVIDYKTGKQFGNEIIKEFLGDKEFAGLLITNRFESQGGRYDEKTNRKCTC